MCKLLAILVIFVFFGQIKSIVSQMLGMDAPGSDMGTMGGISNTGMVGMNPNVGASPTTGFKMLGMDAGNANTVGMPQTGNVGGMIGIAPSGGMIGMPQSGGMVGMAPSGGGGGMLGMTADGAVGASNSFIGGGGGGMIQPSSNPVSFVPTANVPAGNNAGTGSTFRMLGMDSSGSNAVGISGNMGGGSSSVMPTNSFGGNAMSGMVGGMGGMAGGSLGNGEIVPL